MRQTDEELVLQCMEGDQEAFAALVQRYQGAVYATAFYYAGRFGGAEDVAQESFWAAYKSLPQLKDPARFASWLKGIATRSAANWLRRNAAHLRNETPLPHRQTLSIEEARRKSGPGITDTDYDRVHRAIDALPERYRLPVVLRYMQELSYEEIGRFTGESRDEIRGVLNRANGLLREILAEPETVVKQDEETWRRAST